MNHTARLLILSTSLLAAIPAQQPRHSVFPKRSARPSDTAKRTRIFGTIDGIVTDTNLVPLRGAFVTILSSRVRVGTGPNGRFRIDKVPPGQYLLIARRAGYSPTSQAVEVPADDTLRLSFTLTEAAVMLPGVVVAEEAASVKMKEFNQRRKLGFGEFMMADEIDKRGSVFATELFRNSDQSTCRRVGRRRSRNTCLEQA